MREEKEISRIKLIISGVWMLVKKNYKQRMLTFMQHSVRKNISHLRTEAIVQFPCVTASVSNEKKFHPSETLTFALQPSAIFSFLWSLFSLNTYYNTTGSEVG